MLGGLVVMIPVLLTRIRLEEVLWNRSKMVSRKWDDVLSSKLLAMRLSASWVSFEKTFSSTS